MPKSEYTNGPWILHPYNSRMGSLVSYGDIGKGENVACVFALKDAVEGKANARLIAEAPALLEALEDLLEAIPPQSNDQDWWPDELTRAVRDAKKVIDKAVTA